MSDNTGEPVRRRRPLVAGSGVLVFACLFLPTLRVCGDPAAPIEFPFAYHVYLGSALFAAIAVVRSLRAARVLLAIAVAGWIITVGVVLAMLVADKGGIATSLVMGALTLIAVVLLARATHLARPHERGMWLAGSIHGGLVTCWYLLLTSDPDRMWGAYAGLSAGLGFTLACLIALTSARAARREWIAATAPVPQARVVR